MRRSQKFDNVDAVANAVRRYFAEWRLRMTFVELLSQIGQSQRVGGIVGVLRREPTFLHNFKSAKANLSSSW